MTGYNSTVFSGSPRCFCMLGAVNNGPAEPCSALINSYARQFLQMAPLWNGIWFLFTQYLDLCKFSEFDF